MRTKNASSKPFIRCMFTLILSLNSFHYTFSRRFVSSFIPSTDPQVNSSSPAATWRPSFAAPPLAASYKYYYFSLLSLRFPLGCIFSKAFLPFLPLTTSSPFALLPSAAYTPQILTLQFPKHSFLTIILF